PHPPRQPQSAYEWTMVRGAAASPRFRTAVLCDAVEPAAQEISSTGAEGILGRLEIEDHLVEPLESFHAFQSVDRGHCNFRSLRIEGEASSQESSSAQVTRMKGVGVGM